MVMIDTVKRIIREPSRIFWEIRSLSTRVNQWIHKKVGPGDYIHVMKKDWDTLIILDSCRVDLFEECRFFSKSPEVVNIGASESLQFHQQQFYGRTLHDTVYVTANPFAAEIPRKTFYNIISLVNDQWDDDLQVVRPDHVTEAAINAHKQSPDKRIIVHYLQPHQPFLGPSRNHIDTRGWKNEFVFPSPETSDDDLRQGYRENTYLVFQEVLRLLTNITGRIVLTADHGEMIGERQWPIPVKGYEHVPHLYLEPLIKVPWLELEIGERRRIISDDPVNNVVDEPPAERLSALGYR